MYNGINNNEAGDDMINEKDTGALINQIHEVTRDHIDWIKSQLLKPDNFMVAKGREVWIDVPNSKLKNIVAIPSKAEANYREAWAKVYNLAVDYLEGSLSYAYMRGVLDYRTINWPDFDETNADYARGLEIILDEFKRKELERQREIEARPLISVTKSTVTLEPIEIKEKVADTLEEEAMPDNTLEFKPLEDSEKLGSVSDLPANPTLEFVCQKVLDGDKLTKKDVRAFCDSAVNLVILPCQNVDNIKEEKLFFENMHICGEENVNVGAMIYGKATDESEASFELKKIFKLLDQCADNFTKLVIYEVNDDFVIKNKDKEMKLLSFINAYTMVAEGLSREGYTAILSMNLTSKKILEDIYNRYNLESNYEIIYMVLVRELEELSKEDSMILMDPQYDYDVVTLKNPRFNNGEVVKGLLENKVGSAALAKVA